MSLTASVRNIFGHWTCAKCYHWVDGKCSLFRNSQIRDCEEFTRAEKIRCRNCDGKGYVLTDMSGMPIGQCPVCQGTGWEHITKKEEMLTYQKQRREDMLKELIRDTT